MAKINGAERRQHDKLTPLGIFRTERGFTQGEIALVLRITQQQYQRYEAGLSIPTPARREQIARRLGTTSEILWPVTATPRRAPPGRRSPPARRVATG